MAAEVKLEEEEVPKFESRLKMYPPGVDDPRKPFDRLREELYKVKDELSPWGWRSYREDFREKVKAEGKLLGLNASDAEGFNELDGVARGTPVWQEKLDQLLLVEHLKKKVMVAHESFVKSSDLFLECYAWLVRDHLLAEDFSAAVSRVPPSLHDRMDVLQMQMREFKKETQKAKSDFADYKISEKKDRVGWVHRLHQHQNKQLARNLLDETMILWSYATQRIKASTFADANEALRDRVFALETGQAAAAESFEEAFRQWEEERAALSEDLDKYMKLYHKFLRAHEQAMADLAQSQGSADNLAKMVMALNTEKAQLQVQVEDLEKDKTLLTKQLADTRDELAQVKAELRRFASASKETELLLWSSRAEADAWREKIYGPPAVRKKGKDGKVVTEVTDQIDNSSFMGILRESAKREAGLRDQMAVLSALAEGRARHLKDLLGAEYVTQAQEPEVEPTGQAEEAETLPDMAPVLPTERRIRAGLERERDVLLQLARDSEAELVRVITECNATVKALKEKCRQDLKTFRRVELRKAREEFEAATLYLRNRIGVLEYEVGQADAVGPHLPVLQPLLQNQQTFCSACKKAIVFEGSLGK